jgi:hypothetical protein
MNFGFEIERGGVYGSLGAGREKKKARSGRDGRDTKNQTEPNPRFPSRRQCGLLLGLKLRPPHFRSFIYL